MEKREMDKLDSGAEPAFSVALAWEMFSKTLPPEDLEAVRRRMAELASAAPDETALKELFLTGFRYGMFFAAGAYRAEDA